MKTRRFGRTELPMPLFSCGGMRFQQSWRDTGQDIEPEAQQRLEDTVRAGLEVGVTHIETARGYGTSERQLGLLLPRLDRDGLIVQTKIAPESDPQQFVDNVVDSMRRLRVRASGVSAVSSGWYSPKPAATSRLAGTPFSIRNLTTEVARADDSSQLSR